MDMVLILWLKLLRHFGLYIVCIVNELKRSVSLLGSQYTYNVDFGFPTLGDSNLETQQYFYNFCIAFLSLFVAIILDSRLSFQTFNNLLHFLSLIYL